MVSVVVLRSERLQAEAWTAESQRDDVVIRDERVGHIASLQAALTVTVASLNAAAGALVLAKFAEAIDLYELSDVELKVEDRTPLGVAVAVLAELRRLRQEAGGGGLPAYALWPVDRPGVTTVDCPHEGTPRRPALR